jgi:hypothetical protein
MSDRDDDDFMAVGAVMNGDGEAAQHTLVRVFSAWPSDRVLGDVLDRAMDLTQEIVA